MDEAQKKFLQQLGLHIKKLRTEKGMSQRQLGYATGKEQKAINRMENAQTNVSIFFLYEIAEGLGVTLSELLDFEYEEKVN